MPPMRTNMGNKPLKTERTHEENQERAYIAASRRSDRSLEARIESARRASEIHKKRTGRGLRVTEQDVINEEMYEEEDDDLPSQYRRLQAHIASTADIFNGRLNSYLLSSMGTRNMFLNGMSDGMNPQQPQTPFFSYTPPNMLPPSAQGLPPGATRGQQSFRQSPYPMQPFRPNPQPQQQQQRSSSVSSAHELTGTKQPAPNSAQDAQTNDQRRSSMPSPPAPSTPQQSGSRMRPPMARNVTGTAGILQYGNQSMSPCDMWSPQTFNGISSFDPMAFNNNNDNLMTTQFPVEMQQIIGNSTLDPISNAHFMNQSHGMPVPQHGISYTYNPNFNSEKLPQNAGSNGMNQTLSQSALSMPNVDTNLDQMPTSGYSPHTTYTEDVQTPTYVYSNHNFFGGFADVTKSAEGTHATTTPNAEYDSLINFQEE